MPLQSFGSYRLRNPSSLGPALLLILASAPACSDASSKTANNDNTSNPSEEASAALQQLQSTEHFALKIQQAGRLVLDSEGAALAKNTDNAKPSRRRALKARLPSNSHAPLHLGLSDRPGFWAELSEQTQHPSVQAELVGERALVFASAFRDCDIVHIAGPGRVEEFRLLHSEKAPPESVYSMRTGPDVHTVRLREGRIELLDKKGRSELASAAPYAVDQRGTKRFLSLRLEALGPSEHRLYLSLDTQGLAYPIAVDPAWYAVPPMSESRTQHQAVLLADGRVLVSGGASGFSAIDSAEIYDPISNTWSGAAPMNVARKLHSLTLLPSGKVLAAGGYSSSPTSSTEIYDPAQNTWTQAASFKARSDHLSHRMQSGKVFVAWGGDSTPQLYDEATGAWTNLSDTPTSYVANAAMMQDEKILVVPFSDKNDAYLYDPMAGTSVYKGPTPGVPRSQSAGIATKGGKVLFAGGYESGGNWPPSVIVWDSLSEKWSFLGLSQGRTSATVTLLPDDTVLFAGGTTGGLSIYATVELLSPGVSGTMQLTDMLVPREAHTATLLKTGQVLMTGGVTETAEIYGEADTGKSCGTSGECLTGFCVDGLCCNTACTGQCEACDVMGQEGICTAVMGAPHGTRAACDKGASICMAAACDGVEVNSCAGLAGAEVECAPGFCNMGGYLAPSYCDGMGQCVAGESSDCGAYACEDGTGCRTDCTMPDHCVNGNACNGGVCGMNGVGGGGGAGGSAGSGGSGSGGGEEPTEPGGCCGVARSGVGGAGSALLVFGLGMGAVAGRRRRREAIQ